MKRNLSLTDDVRPVGRGRLEVVQLGETTFGRITYEPGWRWSEDVKPLVGTATCESRHVGVVISGRLHVEMDDGATMEVGRDDAFDIPPGHDAWVVGDEAWVSIDSVGRRHFGKARDPSEDRVLASILFTDLVGSTALAAKLGDHHWRERLGEYHVLARANIEKHRGREIASTGDGILAVIDSPARAVHCAMALAASARRIGLVQRAGVHTGEVEYEGAEVRGIAVHLAARVAATAKEDQVLVSAMTYQLLAGSGLTAVSRGDHELKGIDGTVELFLVDE